MKCNYIYDGKKYTEKQILKMIGQGKFASLTNQTLKTEIEALSEMLGMTSDEIVVVKGLIDNNALGQFTEDGKILLSNLMEPGTGYHEAFHKVFNTYLTESEVKSILSEISDDKASSLKDLYPDYTLDELKEEILAEEFREYILNNGLGIKRDSLWNRLLNFLNKLLGINRYTKATLFLAIRNGSFKGKKPVKYSFKKKDSRVFSEFTNSEKYEIISAARYYLASRLTQDIDDEGNPTYNSKKINDIIKDRVPPVVLYNTIRFAIGDILQSIKDENKRKIFENIYVNQFDELINELYSIFNEFKISIDISDENISSEDGVKDSVEFKPSFETSETERMSSLIKLLIASIPNLDNEGNEIEGELGLFSSASNRIIPLLYSKTADCPPYMIMDVLSEIDDVHVQDLVNNIFGQEYDENNQPIYNEYTNYRNEFIKTLTSHRHEFYMVANDGSEANIFDTNRNKLIDGLKAKFRDYAFEAINNLTEESQSFNFNTQARQLVHLDLRNELIEAVNDTLYSKFKSLKSTTTDIETVKIELRKFIAGKDKGSGIGSIDKVLKKQENYEVDTALSVTSVDGSKKLYTISLNNNMSIILGQIDFLFKSNNNIVNKWYDKVVDIPVHKTREEKIEAILRKEFPQIYRPSLQGVQWVKDIQAGKVPKIVIFSGTKINEDARETKDLELPDLAYTNLIAYKGGIHLAMKHGDRSTFFAFKNTYHIKDSPIDIVQKLYDEQTKNLFLDFSDKGFNIPGSATTMVPDLEQVVLNIINDLVDYKLIKDVVYEKGKVVDLKFTVSSLQDVNALEFIYNFAATSTINFLNESLLLYGDIRLFKNGADFFKRLTGFSSTGKNLISGNEVENYIEDRMNSLSNFVQNEGLSLELNNNRRYAREITVEDHEFTNDFIKDYDKGVEFDGASWISFSANLSFNIRAGLYNKEKEFGYKLQALALAKLKEVKNQKEADKALNDIFNIANRMAEEYVVNEYFNKYLADSPYDDERSKKTKKEQYEKEIEEYNKNKDYVNAKFVTKLLEPLTPLKPQYMGPFVYKNPKDWELNADHVIGMRKTAYFVLDPITALENFDSNYTKTLLYAENNKIDFIHAESASKVGYDKKRFTKFYNEKGEYVLDTYDIQKYETFLDWKYMKNQVEIPPKEKTKTIDSTQKRKIILANLNVYDEDGNLIKDKTDENYKLAKEYILTYANIYRQIIDEYNDYMNEDFERLIKTLSKAKPDNVKEAIDKIVDLLSNDKLAIDSSPFADKIEQLLLSSVSNNFVGFKRPGNMYVQHPVTLFETGNRGLSKDKRYSTSDRLKFGMYNDEGVKVSEGGTFIAEIEIPLPQKYITAAFNMLKKEINNGRELDYNLYNAVLIFNERYAGQMKTVGLRIPNQQVSSTAPLTVKKFSLPTVSNKALVPTDIVWMSGGDFDIDKITIYLPSIDKEGYEYRLKKGMHPKDIINRYLKYIGYSEEADLIRERLEGIRSKETNSNIFVYFSAITDKNITTLKEASGEIPNLKQRVIDNSLDEGSYNRYVALLRAEQTENMQELNSLLEEIVPEKFRNLPIEAQQTRYYLFNKLLDIEYKLLANRPKELVRKLDDARFKEDIVDGKDTSVFGRLKQLMSDNAKYWEGKDETKSRKFAKIFNDMSASKKIDVPSIYQANLHWTKKAHYADSKFGVGVVATEITHHSITQYNGMYYLTLSEVTVTNAEGNKEIIPIDISFDVTDWRLDKEFDSKMNDIMESISMILTAQVDAGKDPYSYLMGLDKTTLGVYTAMIRFGIDPYNAILLINNPRVKEYTTNEHFENTMIVSSDNFTDFKSIEEYILTQGINGGPLNHLNENLTETLEKLIKSDDDVFTINNVRYNSEELNDVMLTVYLQFKKINLDLLNQKKLHSSDTQRVKDSHQYMSIMESGSKVKFLNSRFGPVNNNALTIKSTEEADIPLAMQRTTTHHSRNYYEEVVSKNHYINPAANTIANVFKNDKMSAVIMNDFKAYIVSKHPKIKELLDKFDSKKFVQSLDNHKDNAFIQNMLILGELEKDKDSATIKDKVQNNDTAYINYISTSFTELPQDIQEGIYLQTFIQSAFNPGPYSLFRILPFKGSVLEQGIDLYLDYNQKELDRFFEDFIYEAFWLNNPRYKLEGHISYGMMGITTKSTMKYLIEKNTGYEISNKVLAVDQSEVGIDAILYPNYTGSYYRKNYNHTFNNAPEKKKEIVTKGNTDVKSQPQQSNKALTGNIFVEINLPSEDKDFKKKNIFDDYSIEQLQTMNNIDEILKQYGYTTEEEISKIKQKICKG